MTRNILGILSGVLWALAMITNIASAEERTLPLSAAECLLHLPLNEGAGVAIKDASGFKNKLSLEGDQWQVDGNNQYRKFQGKGNCVRVWNEHLMPAQFTLSFWILPHLSSETDKDQILFGSASSDGAGWRGGYSVYVRPKGGMYELQLVIRLQGQTWYGPIGRVAADKLSFVSITYDQNNIHAYINGERTFEKAETRAISYGNNKNAMCIGTPSWGDFPFYGLLKDFRFYQGALASDEIAALYKASAGVMTYQEKPVAGESNYYVDDKLHGPEYQKCRNLLQNPSFEAGGRYWMMGVSPSKECSYKIDTTESHSGKSSLWMRGAAGERELCFVYSFAIPAVPEQDYTLSFYAKSDKSAFVGVRHFTGVHPEYVGTKNFKLTPQWQRYSITFKAKNAILAPCFEVTRFPKEDCDVRLDDIQLEAGSQMTEFTQKPVLGRLRMEGQYNTIQPGEKANAQFQIMGNPNEKGTLQLDIKDFAGQWIRHRTAEFDLDSDGQWQIPFAELDALPKGAYVIRAQYKLQSGFEDSDYFRFAVMEYLHDDSPLKYFFATFQSNPVSDPGQSLALLSNYGYGWLRANPGLPSKAACQLMDQYGFQYESPLMYYGNTPWELDGTDGFKAPNFAHKGEDRASNLGFDKYPDIIESCRRVAKSRPDIKLWFTENESLGGTRTNQEEWVRKYSAMIGAIAKAVKEVNPEARVITPTTTQIYPNGGQASIEEFVREQGSNLNTYFDLVGAHTYRPRPEQPDLDGDISGLTKMLAKYDFRGNISFDEDIYYTPYNIPKLGLNVTQFSDFWSPRFPISYDMGVGERMASAYNARHWLIALKYYPKVQRALVLCFADSYLDMEITPRLFNWAPNTIRHMFGKDCRFDRDIKLSDDVRCYLYKDGEGRPLAALWNINEEIDREKREPFNARMPFGSSEAEVIDFVGNRVAFNSGDAIPVRSTPMFLRSQNKDGNAFAVLLEKIDIEGSRKRIVEVSTMVSSVENITVKIKNTSREVVAGSLSVQSAGRFTGQIKLAAGEEKIVNVKLPPVIDGTLTKIPLAIDFAAQNGKTIYHDTNADIKMFVCKKARSPITSETQLSDWPGIGVKLDGLLQDYPVPVEFRSKFPSPPPWKGPEDLSATLYTAWDENYFYVAVDVVDDVFCPAQLKDNPWKYPWNCDSLQIYFDTFGDARNHATNDYDNNDYSYTAWNTGGTGNDALKVSREQVPEWQLCFLKTGDAPKVKRSFKKTSRGYLYQLVFPLSELAPMVLKSGNAVGFALLINDNDNDYRKRVISLTAPGREPFGNPKAWPIMLLSDDMK